MRCPKCGCTDDKVIDSRAARDGGTVRRRRECLSCGHRFSTLESVVPEDMKVVKRNGEREDYDRDKLRRGIANACWKRPVPDEDIDRIADTVTNSLLHDFDKEVPSSEIGERIMAELLKVDEVAFVRFASVYRKFTAVKDFVREIKGIKK